MDLLLDIDARAGAAALALVEEEPEEGALDCRVDIGIGKDHVRAFAAELEADALEVALGGCLHDEMADLGRAGKGDLVDAFVFDQRRPGIMRPVNSSMITTSLLRTI